MTTDTSRKRRRYNALSHIYDLLLRAGSLGAIDFLYRAVADAIQPIPGGTLIEFGCGPGSVTPHLRPKVEPGGQVIGIDLADKMIDRARRRAQREGWTDVRYECADASRFEPQQPVDAIVFSLSLSVIPDCHGVLTRAVSLLEPGGQLVVLDSIPDRSHPMGLALMYLKAPLVGARPTGVPLTFAAEQLENVDIQRMSLGTYTVVSGRKPRI